jgi:hypothetical protein
MLLLARPPTAPAPRPRLVPPPARRRGARFPAEPPRQLPPRAATVVRVGPHPEEALPRRRLVLASSPASTGWSQRPRRRPAPRRRGCSRAQRGRPRPRPRRRASGPGEPRP